MRSRLLVIALSLVLAPTIAHAQQASPDSMPHAGTWGAEVFLGNAGSGASLLRFRSANVALLFGADLSYSRLSDDDGTLPTVPSSTTTVGARLGLRNYRGSIAERVRPLVGAGLRTSYSKTSNVRAWGAGAYGELGAMYFLTPHVSLGGSGELQVTYGKREQTVFFQTGNQESSKQNNTTVTASLVRVMLAVYF